MKPTQNTEPAPIVPQEIPLHPDTTTTYKTRAAMERVFRKHKLPKSLRYIVATMPDGRLTPVFTNVLSVPENSMYLSFLPHKGWMVVG